MQERLAYIALNQMAGLGPVGVRRLIAALGSPQAIWIQVPYMHSGKRQYSS